MACHGWKHSGKAVLEGVAPLVKVTDFKATTDGDLTWTQGLGTFQEGVTSKLRPKGQADISRWSEEKVLP